MAQYDIDIRDYWRIIKKRKSIIILAMLTMFLFSFVFAEYKKSTVVEMYTSSATIRIDKVLSNEEYIMAAYGYSSTPDIATEVKTMTSFPVLAEVSAKMGYLPDSLKTMPAEQRNQIVQRNPMLLGLVNSIGSMIRPERFEYTNIIIVNTIADNPQVARDLAQAVVESYGDVLNMNVNQRKASTIRFIEEKTSYMEAELDSILKRVNAFNSPEKGGITLSDGAITREIDDLYRRQNENERRQYATTLMIDALEKEGMVDDSVVSSAFADEEGTAFRNIYMELMGLYDTRDEYIQYLTPEHPDVKQTGSRIEAARRNLVMILKSNLKNLQLSRESIDFMLNDLRTRLRVVSAQNDTLSRLEGRRGMIETQYAKLIEELQQVQIKKSENIDEVTIIKPAVFSYYPINAPSSVKTISFIGLFLGLIIGLVAAFIFEAMDMSIGTIEDVEAHLGVPVIGLIPQVDQVDMKNQHTVEHRKKMRYDIGENQSMLVIHYAPKSPLAESYRSLRTNIQFLTYENELKVLLFTSSSPREGKTTTIVNLALTIAQSGNRVLLVDSDMRKPRINSIFGLEKEQGLSEIILGRRHWRECVKTVADIITGELGMSDIILEPGIDNLHIITCGAIPPNPSELLSSESMDDFIREIRAEYDMVLFDCAPTLPATDSAVLGRKIDGVVLVYAVGKVSRGSLKRTKAQLDTVKANVVGTVLNGMRSDLSVDFHDYKYKEYYYAYTVDETKPVNTIGEKAKRLFDGLIGRKDF